VAQARVAPVHLAMEPLLLWSRRRIHRGRWCSIQARGAILSCAILLSVAPWRHSLRPSESSVPPPLQPPGRWSWSPDSRSSRRAAKQEDSRDAELAFGDVTAKVNGRRTMHQGTSGSGSGPAVNVKDKVVAGGWFSQLQGLDVDAQAFKTLVDSSLKSGDFREVDRWATQALEDGVELEASKFLVQFQQALDKQDVAAAKVWSRLAIQAGSTIEEAVLTDLTWQLIEEESWVELRPWLTIVWKGPGEFMQRSAGSLNRLLRLANLTSSGALDGLADVEVALEDALNVGMEVDVECFNIVIFKALELHEMDSVSRWFQRAFECGTVLPTTTINRIILQVAKTDELGPTEVWFARASDAGFAPNTFTFKYMLHAASHDPDPKAAVRWFNCCVDSGVKPDLSMINNLIAIAAKAGRWSEAEDWFEEARKADVQPDLRTFRLLITAAATFGNFAGAEKWFARIADALLVPDVAIFNTMLSTAMKSARPWRVEELFWRMLDLNVMPDELSLRTMRFSLGRQKVAELCREASIDPL